MGKKNRPFKIKSLVLKQLKLSACLGILIFNFSGALSAKAPMSLELLEPKEHLACPADLPAPHEFFAGTVVQGLAEGLAEGHDVPSNEEDMLREFLKRQIQRYFPEGGATTVEELRQHIIEQLQALMRQNDCNAICRAWLADAIRAIRDGDEIWLAFTPHAKLVNRLIRLLNRLAQYYSPDETFTIDDFVQFLIDLLHDEENGGRQLIENLLKEYDACQRWEEIFN